MRDYIRDRMDRMRDRRDRMIGRNDEDYRRGRRDYEMDERRGRRDYEDDYARGRRRDYNDYEMDYRGRGRDYGDYEMNYDMRGDYSHEEEKYEKELEEWCEELKHYDKFKLPKEEVIRKAKQMGIRFEKYEEKEFLCTYYMMMSDYPEIATDPHKFIYMAKQFLEDKDAKRKDGEKLYYYYCDIVKGK